MDTYTAAMYIIIIINIAEPILGPKTLVLLLLEYFMALYPGTKPRGGSVKNKTKCGNCTTFSRGSAVLLLVVVLLLIVCSDTTSTVYLLLSLRTFYLKSYLDLINVPGYY